jgi:hypothetical protein
VQGASRRIRAVAGADLGRRHDHRQGLAHEFRPRGDEFVGDERGSSGCRLYGEQRSLASGARAHVQPHLALGDRPCAAQGERRELRALVLDARAPLSHGRNPKRVAAIESNADR